MMDLLHQVGGGISAHPGLCLLMVILGGIALCTVGDVE